MLRYTVRLASSLLSPASVLLCQGEGGIDVGPFMKPATPFGVDLARCILCLSGCEELTGKRQRRDPEFGGRDEVGSLGTEPSSRPPTAALTRGQSKRLALLSDILMSGRPDQIIFSCWGWGLCSGRRGGCWMYFKWAWDIRLTGRVSQKVVTDRRTVGTGDRGHPGLLWPNMGAFYWFIKPLTPHHPSTGNALADEWRDHVNEEEGGGRGDSRGGRGMSKRGLWMNLRFSEVCRTMKGIHFTHVFKNTAQDVWVSSVVITQLKITSWRDFWSDISDLIKKPHKSSFPVTESANT